MEPGRRHLDENTGAAFPVFLVCDPFSKKYRFRVHTTPTRQETYTVSLVVVCVVCYNSKCAHNHEIRLQLLTRTAGNVTAPTYSNSKSNLGQVYLAKNKVTHLDS